MAEVSFRKRQQSLLLMVGLLLALLLFGVLLANFLVYLGLISAEERLLALSVVALPGLFVTGVYISRRFAANHEEYAWGVTVFLMLTVFIGGFIYLLYLNELGFELSLLNFILYIFLLLLPVAVAIGFSVYEILTVRKTGRTFMFHLKRFAGRMFLAELVFLLVAIISSVINFLKPFVPERFLVTILIFANLAVGLMLWLMVKNPRVGRFLSKLERGDW